MGVIAESSESDSGETGPQSVSPERFPRELIRFGLVPAWVALGTVALTFALGVGSSAPPALRYLPFLASLVVLGLPHGAADHLAVARLGGSRPRLAVGATYLLGGGAYLALWVVAPVLGFVSFVLLTWYHWGQGDLYLLGALDGDHLSTRGQRLLALVVRGGIPMVVPLIAFPGVYRSVATATVGLFDPTGGTALAVAFRPEFRLAAGGGLAILSVGSLALGLRSGRGWCDRGWRVDALELLLLWWYFLVVPPILAVGLYFCLWHSLRHVVRLVAVEADGTAERPLGRERFRSVLAGFGRDALPNTVGASILLGGLGAVTLPDWGLLSLLGLYLVLLAVLTLPHALVVTWMDLRQGVWSV
jgi:Brp/Blh family beta-carotene 15,15'-monooxygenase